MNKKIIIGVASAALAVMPAVGAFAATTRTVTVTDTLSATISSACTFLRYGTAGAGTQTDVTTGPSWSGPTTAGTADNDAAITSGDPYHTYSATLKPTADVELGTSSFIGYCNATGGFEVTVVTPNLATAASDTINFSTTAPNATTGQGWTLAKSGGTLFTNAGSDTKFMSSNASTDASAPVTETATYKVYTNSTTKSGTYKGDVIYTFTYEDPAQ